MLQNISLCEERIKKPSIFFLRESDSSIISHREIYQLPNIRIQFDEKDRRIIYRLTPIIQDT